MLQTAWWAKFKETASWVPQRLDGVMTLTRNLPFGKSLTYIPESPLDQKTLAVVEATKIKAPPGRIFTRFEFFELWTAEKAAALLELGLMKSFEEVQPEYRQWVFLDKPESQILKDMKSKGRYNIKTAERHHLKIGTGINNESIQTLHSLYQETANRADFQGRSADYFRRLAQMLSQNNCGEIVTVSKDNEPLAAVLVSFFGGVASYLYGGSGADRTLMASHLAQWETIKLAKKHGCFLYDLLAVAPPDNQSHPYVGITRFKTQFGGQTVRMLGSWDLVHSPFWYSLYRFAEKRRRKVLR